MLRDLLVILTVLLAAAAACADPSPPPAPAPGQYAEWIPPEMRDVGIDERPAEPLPLDLKFFDEDGNAVTLGSYFDGRRPVVIQLGYYRCPQLCGQVTQGMMDSLKDLSLNLGSDYQLLYVSFDPTETPPLAKQKHQTMAREYGRSEGAGGLHLLTGNKQQILQLSRTVGYRFNYVASQQQYAHPAAIILCTPDGKVSRYLYGTRFDPRTFRLSLVEASQGKIGTTTDRILQICMVYDGSTGKYGPRVATLTMMAGGVLTVIVLGGVLGSLYLKEYRQRRASAD